MNDSRSHQLEQGELEELGGAAGQRRTHMPPGPAPRLEAPGGTVGGGAARLGGPGGWAYQHPLEARGGVGRGLLPHSLGGPSRLSLPPLPGRGPRLPAAAAQAVEAGGARLPAVLAPVAGLARARAVHRVAAAAEALAITFAARAERALPALAAAALLLARRRVAGALIVAAAAPPARVAQARARLRVAARRGAAVARAGALRAPPAGLAAARAGLGVAAAVGTAGARKLAAVAPAVRLAVAHAGGRFALAVRVAGADLPAVGAPVLARAACDRARGDGRGSAGSGWARMLAARPLVCQEGPSKSPGQPVPLGHSSLPAHPPYPPPPTLNHKAP